MGWEPGISLTYLDNMNHDETENVESSTIRTTVLHRAQLQLIANKHYVIWHYLVGIKVFSTVENLELISTLEFSL